MDVMMEDPLLTGKRSGESPDPPTECKRPKIEEDKYKIPIPPLKGRYVLVPLSEEQIQEIESNAIIVGRIGYACGFSLERVKDIHKVVLLEDGWVEHLYDRLIPNTRSTRRPYNISISWNVDLEKDQQYVKFYEELEPIIRDEVPNSRKALNEEMISGFHVAALSLSRKDSFRGIYSFDVRECINDIIHEKTVIQRSFEPMRDYHLKMLNQGYTHQDYAEYSLEDDRHLPFLNTMAIYRYENWHREYNIGKLDKAGKVAALQIYHDRAPMEECPNRYRYLKLKLKLAEDLGLIKLEDK